MRKRNRKGQFTKGHARTRHVARRRTRRAPRVAVAIANPRRRRRTRRTASPSHRRVAVRHYRRNPIRRRRSYRRNPSMGGFGGLFASSTLKTIGLTAGGFVAVPFIEGFVAKFIPATMQSKLTSYAVKIGSVIGLSWLANRFLGRDAGMKVAIGGGAYVAIVAVKDLFPTLLPASAGMGAYLRQQPMLGAYQRGYMGSRVTTNVPGRLQPQSTY